MTDNSGNSAQQPSGKKRAVRQKREADALKRNMARRKQQQKSRTSNQDTNRMQEQS